MEFKTLFQDIKKHIIEPSEDLKIEFAAQCNITGDGEGIFYIAYQGGFFEVAPYDYLDRNALLIADWKTYIDLFDRTISFADAIKSGKLEVKAESDVIPILEKFCKPCKDQTIKKLAFQKPAKKEKVK